MENDPKSLDSLLKEAEALIDPLPLGRLLVRPTGGVVEDVGDPLEEPKKDRAFLYFREAPVEEDKPERTIVGFAYWSSWGGHGTQILYNNSSVSAHVKPGDVIYGNLDRILLRLAERFPSPEKDLLLFECEENPPQADVKIHLFTTPKYQGESSRRAKYLARKHKKIIYPAAGIRPERFKPPFYIQGSCKELLVFDPERSDKEAAKEAMGEFTRDELRSLLRGINDSIWSAVKRSFPTKREGCEIDYRPLAISEGKRPGKKNLLVTCSIALGVLQNLAKSRDKKFKEWMRDYKGVIDGHIKSRGLMAKALKREMRLQKRCPCRFRRL